MNAFAALLNGAPVAGNKEADNIYHYIDEEQQASEGRGRQESGLALRSEEVVATIHAEDPLGQREHWQLKGLEETIAALRSFLSLWRLRCFKT
jgi:hypothetical protein